MGRLKHAGISILVSSMYWGLSLLALSQFYGSHSASQTFVLALYLGVFFFVVLMSMKIFCGVHGGSAKRKILELIAFSVGVSFVLEAGTIIGTPDATLFALASWSKVRLLFFTAATYTMAFILIFLLKVSFTKYSLDSIWGYLCGLPWWKIGVAFVGLITVSLLFALGISVLFSVAFFPIFTFFFAVSFCIVLLMTQWKLSSFHLEHFFLAVTLFFGGYICVFTPTTTGLSWDDQIHFDNAVNASYLISPHKTNTEIYFSDIAVLRAQGEEVMPLSNWGVSDALNESRLLNASYASDIEQGLVLTQNEEEALYTLTSFGAIPSAIGLWLGRLFHFPFSCYVLMGRMFNLLAYALFFYFAIKIAPAKKIVFMLVGLLPTSIFLASNFAYDSWIVSLIALGIALLMREMWGGKRAIDFSRIALSSIVFLLGLTVKPVYFPLLGLYFLMPKSRFASKKQRIQYYLFILLIGMVAVSFLIFPLILASQVGGGDIRGGSGVDSGEQLRFILGNPLRYVSILGNYLLTDYLLPEASYKYSINFAYLGYGVAIPEGLLGKLVSALPIIVLLAVGLIDGNEMSDKFASVDRSVWSAVLVGASVVLVATALYISFTPVGLNTVNGCQARYLLPCLIAFFVFSVNNKSSILGRMRPYTGFAGAFAILFANVCCTYECVLINAIA